MPPKLSLAMIVRNEEQTLPRVLASAALHVDEIVIADTGSTDRTKEVAAQFGAKVIDCNPTTHPDLFFRDCEELLGPLGCAGPFSNEMTLGNFGGARNVSFQHATGDYVLWLDADDRLENGAALRPLVARMAETNLQAVFLPYHYAYDDKQRVICHLWRERIVRRGTCAWMNPIHEVLGPLDGARTLNLREMVVHHHRSAERTAKVAHRNYKVLLLHMKNGAADDARTLFYFGNEAKHINADQAINAYERYVELSGWPEERCMGRMYLGELYESRKQIGRAYAQYAAATIDMPAFPDGWFGLARLAYFRNDWTTCAQLSEEGFKRGLPESVIMINPLSRTHVPHLFFNTALNNLGRVQEALDSCEKGLQAVPEDGMLAFNRNVYRKYLDDKSDPVKLALASDRTPQQVKDAIVKTLAQLNAPTPLRAVEGKKSIVIWTGPAVEWWSPKSVNTTGIGGSETAVVEMGKHFAAMGHKVVVYSDCPHMDGIYDGVEYKHFGAFAGTDCDVFISSRQPQVMDADVRAPVKLLWVHDIHCGGADPAMHQRLLRFDRYLCLTEWHKRCFLSAYPFIHPSSVIVTRNGIDPARFAGELPPKKNRAIYSSSPNRGLDVLLDLWPRVTARVPDAELHVFYGFESWEKSAQLSNNAAELETIKRYRDRLATTPGVAWRGRVSQAQLAQEMKEAKVWAYPTWFTETYCITAVECQAAGCVPVTTELAALSETVFSGLLLRGANTDPEYQAAFVDQVVTMLTQDELRQAIAEAGRARALSLSWESLAVDWVAMFDQVAREVAAAKVPRYEQMKGKAA